MLILTSQRVARNKRPSDTVKIIEGIREEREVDFVWIGNGNPKDLSLYLPGIKSVGSWINEISEKEKQYWFRKADIYISTSEFEGFNLGVAEALSHALPTVVYSYSIYRSLFRDFLIYVSRFNLQEFISTLKAVIDNYDYYKDNYGKPGRRLILENFSKRVVAKRILKALEKVI